MKPPVLFRSFIVFLWLSPRLVANIPSVPQEVETQFQGLRKILQQADEAYFNENRSPISDEAYDHLRHSLAQLLTQYPSLSTRELSNFPTDPRNRIPHSQPVLSLRKVYSDEEVAEFCNSVSQDTAAQLRFLVEPKLDGASILIQYSNGKLIQALTRGDSLSGIEVTPVILASQALPLNLENAPTVLQLRGEAYIEKKHFDTLNHQKEANGKPVYSHARNDASGTLMLTDFEEIIHRKLRIQIFEWINAEALGYTCDSKALQFLHELGLPVVDFEVCNSSLTVISTIQRQNPLRKDLDYETDGWVVKVDDLPIRKQMGNTKKFPHWAIARKFRREPVITTVLHIEFSKSENGKTTPVALLDPISIDGARIQRATLHSLNFMQSMGIQSGSRVKVIRAGGVTPEIVGLAE